MKKYDYVRYAPSNNKTAETVYAIVRTNHQDPVLARCKDRDTAQKIVDALNANA